MGARRVLRSDSGYSNVPRGNVTSIGKYACGLQDYANTVKLKILMHQDASGPFESWRIGDTPVFAEA